MDKCQKLRGLLVKDFSKYAETASKRLEEASVEAARRLGRPIEYLMSSRIDKEENAWMIAKADGIQDGLVCVLQSIEPCASFEVYRNSNIKQLQLKSHQRKFMNLYHYQMHPIFGWLNAGIQTWFPFPIQICLKGREWPARQLDLREAHYAKHDNCLVWRKDKGQAHFL